MRVAVLLNPITSLHRLALPGKIVNQKVKNVLFVCSGNSGRSIMAESILEKLGQGCFRAYSAGGHPTGRINPLAAEQLTRRGYRTAGLASKSWDIFLMPDSPAMDVVITVCAAAAREKQPGWPGTPQMLLWEFQDPGTVQGTDRAIRQSFSDICDGIESAIELFLEQNGLPRRPAAPTEPQAQV
jgi:arsenate reductase